MPPTMNCRTGMLTVRAVIIDLLHFRYVSGSGPGICPGRCRLKNPPGTLIAYG